MHVVATAGHVDHGKSSLVRALTGSEPDRLAHERDRGLTVELGYVWTSLPGVGDVAFVDVPGHERFISTALGGFGPVPAVLFVVAADDDFMPQAAEHLAALDALGVRHGVVAVTRSDLAGPAPAAERARARLAGTSLRDAPVIPVSSRTGEGLDAVRAALVSMVQELPEPDPAEPVRLWADRSFTMTGAGVVVTGTLPAGSVRTGDRLSTAGSSGAGGSPTGNRYRVRSVQSLGQKVDVATGVARVALNVVGEDPIDRGDVLVTPGAWHFTEVVDVRLGTSYRDGEVFTGSEGTTSYRAAGGDGAAAGDRPLPPKQPMLHIGSTLVAVHQRPLGTEASGLSRLTLDRALPLRIGDRALLRDPGTRALWNVTVLDPAPPELRWRGAARDRAQVLEGMDGRPDVAGEINRREVVSAGLLSRLGAVPAGIDPGQVVPDSVVRAGDWLMSADRAEEVRRDAVAKVREHAHRSPVDPGLSLTALAVQLDLPDAGLVARVVTPLLVLKSGRAYLPGQEGPPAEVLDAVAALRDDLDGAPFAAPTADRLTELGFDGRVRGAAVRAGLVLQPADGIVLLAGADDLATRLLAEIPQPFTASEARRKLGTTRRIMLPLLAHLDRTGRTRRLPDDRREVVREST